MHTGTDDTASADNPVDAGARLARRDWGTVRIADRDLPVRRVILAAAIVVWLGLMLIATGTGGVISVLTAAAFIVPLVLIGSLTRTVPLVVLGWMLLMGGAAMAVAYLGGELFSVFIKSPTAPLRNVVIPLMEEVLKLAPVLFLLWRWRRSGTWALGVTDVMLMAAAAGVGFGLVEDAYVRDSRFGWPGQIALLPVTEILGGKLIVGHAIWTAVAGTTVGLGLLLRHRRTAAILVGTSGIAWTTVDHIRTNSAPVGRDSGSGLSNVLTTITANGWLSLWIFLALVVAAIVIDLAIGVRTLPRRPEVTMARSGVQPADRSADWAFRVHRRALAYASFRGRRATQPARDEVEGVAYRLVTWLVAHGGSPAPSDAAPGGAAP
jgi:RsiW-degrading membrane proteinase PrsW (M82 family)